jgi:hypothetical protein
MAKSPIARIALCGVTSLVLMIFCGCNGGVSDPVDPYRFYAGAFLSNETTRIHHVFRISNDGAAFTRFPCGFGARLGVADMSPII